MAVSSVAGLIAGQASNVQSQIATTVLAQNLKAQKSTVLELLGAGQQSASPAADAGPGLGGKLDVSA
jgi:hypothetical protein